jgi:metallo-beta-lactamase class B
VSSTDVPPYGKVSANGLLIKGEEEAVLVDTGWNDEQARLLYEWVAKNWGVKISKVIVTHSHADRMGGLAILQQYGVRSYSLQRTQDICRENHLPVTDIIFKESMTIPVKPYTLELWFPGEGHTVDSICVYIREAGLLFGGCSVKSLETQDLGNRDEANMRAWPVTIRNMQEKYPDTRLVIPGHGEPGDRGLLSHTLSLF